MDEEYDAVILGTGLKQCVLSGILSFISGKKILLLDKNGYYGGAGPTLHLQQLFEYFGRLDCDISGYGKFRNWNVDLITKLLMANGSLVKLLVTTGVVRYLDFKVICGRYVYRAGEVRKVTLIEVDIQDVFGHALHRDDDYLNKPAIDKNNRERRYSNTFAYPYVYPLFGLAGIQEGFSRLCALHGGMVMLQQRFEGVTLGDDGKVTGVTCGGMTVKCKQVIADPSYFPERCKKVGQVVRAICLLQDGIPNTDSSKSCQIFIPQSQVGRKNDIYVVCLSYDHNVCDNNWYVAMVSTTVETDTPEEELEPGIQLLGPVSETFVSVSDLYEPIDDGRNDNIFVCSSYDATSHFETTSQDIIRIYENSTGEPLDFSTQDEIPGESQEITDTNELTDDIRDACLA